MSNKKFFLKSTLIQISFFSLIYLIFTEIIIRKYIVPIDFHMKSADLFIRSKTNNTVWGDSQMAAALSNLAGFNNFSAGGQTYEEIERKIKTYYKSREGGKMVILQLALNGMAEYRDIKVRSVVNEYFQSRKNRPILYISSLYFQRRSFQYVKNFFQNNFKIVVNKNSAIFNHDGSFAFKGIYNPVKNKDGIYKIDNQFLPKRDLLNDRNYKALLRIIEYLKNQNFDICLISTPWHRHYRDNLTDIDKFKELRILYNDLSKKNKLRYIDYTELNFLDDFFYDETHLNPQGSKYFTKKVFEDCLN